MKLKNPFSECELIWTSLKIVTKKIVVEQQGFIRKDKTPRYHPTQKPIALYEWILMNYAKDGFRILDTHLGSGSIAIACHNLGYDLEGYELDKEYFDNALKRIKQHQAQTTLF